MNLIYFDSCSDCLKIRNEFKLCSSNLIFKSGQVDASGGAFVHEIGSCGSLVQID